MNHGAVACALLIVTFILSLSLRPFVGLIPKALSIKFAFFGGRARIRKTKIAVKIKRDAYSKSRL